ncbi:hypothetical protein [Amycolatopsis taiwanensis]|uniref:Uncharacterized protein n=1 Tax=Amycolatopsis taiwanensis TaxID=342230 RepID=A0A9W6VAY4_9PSEU|nr:hypothetical protein [Amycolatopsis taiwanensis]GLY64343.1 hypothetical protein Atai01_09620 [Amycolatopsis taiwanensis]
MTGNSEVSGGTAVTTERAIAEGVRYHDGRASYLPKCTFTRLSRPGGVIA